VNKLAGGIEDYSKFEVHAVVKFLQAKGESERDSSQVSECLWPERLQPKESVCVVQQI
jgi:hypothetical protein